MTVPPDYDVYLGTRDWRHEDWVAGFYPPDLPEDWRLAYYSTRFSCVWLDASAWPVGDASLWASWISDTPDAFRFLLEGVEDATWTTLRGLPGHERILRPSGIEQQRLLWFDRDSDLRWLSDRVQSARADPPLYLLSLDHDLDMVERVRTLMRVLGL